eukprot:2247368-Prymnesium_polylepis.3
MDVKLDEINPGASELLAANGWPDMKEVARLLSVALPARISIPWTPGASRAALAATVDDLAAAMLGAKPVLLDSLPSRDEWLNLRTKRKFSVSAGALIEHGRTIAAVTREVPLCNVPREAPNLEHLTLQPRLAMLEAIKEKIFNTNTSRVLLAGIGGAGKSIIA